MNRTAVNIVPLWIQFGSILCSSEVYFGYMLGSVWVHSGPILELSWGPFWSPFWAHAGPIMGPCNCYVGPRLGFVSFLFCYCTSYLTC
jgi:hypothetical protein